MNPTAVQHSRASSLVARMSRELKPVAPIMKHTFDHSKTYTLEFKSSFFPVLVYFTEVVGQPDLMYIRSTNWRCEDEPCLIVTKDTARAAYTRLEEHGFTRAEKPS